MMKYYELSSVLYPDKSIDFESTPKFAIKSDPLLSVVMEKENLQKKMRYLELVANFYRSYVTYLSHSEHFINEQDVNFLSEKFEKIKR